MLDLEHYQKIALIGFIGASFFGAIASRTHFCTMGAISDWINMGSFTRFRVWLLAMAIAMVGAQSMQAMGWIDLGQSIYLTTNFTWVGYVLGGLIFGIGMTIGSGCGQRTLVRVGGGNLKSLVLVIVMAVTAYMTLRGILALLRLEINDPTAINLDLQDYTTQGIPEFLNRFTGIEASTISLVITVVFALVVLVFVVRDKQLWSSFDNMLAAVGIGFLIAGAWYVTGVVGFDDFDPIPLESVSFIAPVGNSLSFLMHYTGVTINFGIAVVFGMIFGAFVYSVVSGNFRIESFHDRADLVKHLVGGVMMGFGGVMALGCTIGQGLSGVSTLALGSFISLGSIILGCVFALKMQYYLYDDEGWLHAFRSTLADALPGR